MNFLPVVIHLHIDGEAIAFGIVHIHMDCQARDKWKLDFAFNASFTSLNVAKVTMNPGAEHSNSLPRFHPTTSLFHCWAVGMDSPTPSELLDECNVLASHERHVKTPIIAYYNSVFA